MERTVVIYKSKRGSTQKYANWIGEALECPVIREEDFSKKNFELYDNIIFGGWVRAGGIMGFDFIKKNMGYLENKKIVIFAVGLNVMQTEMRMELRDINFDKKSVKGMTCYYCPGAYDPATIKGIDGVIMKMMLNMLAGKKYDEVTENDKKLLDGVKHGIDLTDKKYIEPIVAEFEK